MIIIPYNQLSQTAIFELIQEFVTRDGTETSSADQKTKQVEHQLKTGRAVVVFDETEQTTHIITQEMAASLPPD